MVYFSIIAISETNDIIGIDEQETIIYFGISG